MVFSSVTFLFFFLPAFLLCYALLPFRNTTALAFSALFYVWGEGVFAAVLVLSIVIDHAAGARLVVATGDRSRRRVLAAAISAHLALLVYFKYFGFLVTDLLGLDAVDPRLIPHLPLGISFFTFHSISYLVDIYRGVARPARNIWDLALYLTLFPQLIAGPIVRYASIARQIRRRTVHANHIVHGLLYFAIGLSQKVLIANNVAGVADGIFGVGNESLSGLLAWAGALAYTLQIYFDFAGYSNMAIGLGLFMGFQFPPNFNYPYISQSISEFWRRWHMSLSSWFRDYLYIPLGGNRRGVFATYRNLLVVFLLCGLWHGASWTFVAWGLYHGLLLVLERLGLERALGAVPRPLRHLYAMGAVIVGWVLFRADSFPQATSFLRQMFLLTPPSPNAPGIWEFVNHQQLFFAVLGCVASTPLARALASRFITDRRRDVLRRSAPSRRFGTVADVSFAMTLLAICAVYVASGTYNPFIYFRF